MINKRKILFLFLVFGMLPVCSSASAQNKVYIDKQGVIRWNDTHREVALFGANYCLPSSSDYRAIGYVTSDRKAVIDQDMAHFARMGWQALRISFWGDWENCDKAGNLIDNDHLDLMDYLIYKAKERNIYILFSPITTYSSWWPDGDTTKEKGFSSFYQRSELGTNPKAIEAQKNYLTQMMNHVNKYTGKAIKDEENILFVELINEPHHHSQDIKGSVKYINALADAVRKTGCDKLLFYNISQDFAISPSILKSKVNGVSFGWYPTGLNSGRTLEGNFLRTVDQYDRMLSPDIKKLPRIVYEFDVPDVLTSYMYPAMARTYRSVGTQFAAMFSYDMLQTASRNLGWQTHYLNLEFTPRKAMSAIIAAQIMRKLPAYKKYGNYPQNTTFGNFHISYEKDLAEMVEDTAFYYANNTDTQIPNPAQLRHVVGNGSSTIVNYDGTGIYFLDKISNGRWRLEVYPDIVEVYDPFKMPSPDNIVHRAISRQRTMTINLPDLGNEFKLQALNSGNQYSTETANGHFSVMPGVYILGKGNTDLSILPVSFGNVKMREFVVAPEQEMPLQVIHTPVKEYVKGLPMNFTAKVVDTKDADSVILFYRSKAFPFRFTKSRMIQEAAYDYSVTLLSDSLAYALPEGALDYCISIYRNGKATTFPAAQENDPGFALFHPRAVWTTKIVFPQTDLQLLEPEKDIANFIRTRNAGFSSLTMDKKLGDYAVSLFPGKEAGADFTVGLSVLKKIKTRPDINRAKAIVVRAKSAGGAAKAYLTLVDSDLNAFGKTLTLTDEWKDYTINQAEWESTRSVMLPMGFPDNLNYWLASTDPKAPLNLNKLENIQFSLRPDANGSAIGYFIKNVRIVF